MKKSIGYLVIMTVLLMNVSCKNNETLTPNNVVVEGFIQKIGITTYQYGTHILLKDKTSTEVNYALKSSKIPLDDYIDQKVKITAKVVEGYPVDGGPKYLEVESVQK
jgi:hypothetical protein